MNRFKIFTGLLVGTALFASADVIFFADDFDGNQTGPTFNPTGHLTITPVTDPLGGPNMVGQIDLSGSNQWNNALNRNFAVPPTTVPGVDSLSVTYRVYIPSSSIAERTAANNTSDVIGSFIRLNGTQPDSNPPSSQTTLNDTFPVDQWVNIVHGGLIPAVDNTDTNLPVTTISTLMGFRDRNQAGVPGLFAYIDDVSISVTESIPEPATFGFFAFGTACLYALRRRRS